VVDDASTDGTAKLIDSLAAEAAVPIRLIRRHANSGGPAVPMNDGIEAAHGDLISLLDQDDEMLPEKLARQGAVLEEHPEVDLVLSDYELFNAEGVMPETRARDVCGEALAMLVRGPGPVHIVDAAACLAAFIAHGALPRSCSNQFFRKSLWRRAGGYNPRVGAPSDYDFLMRAIDGPVAWIDAVLFRKRRHEGNLWRPSFENRLRSLHAQQQAMRRFPREPQLRRLVADNTRQMAQELRWNGRHRLAMVEAMRLGRLCSASAGVVELGKTCAAMLRDGLTKAAGQKPSPPAPLPQAGEGRQQDATPRAGEGRQQERLPKGLGQ